MASKPNARESIFGDSPVVGYSQRGNHFHRIHENGLVLHLMLAPIGMHHRPHVIVNLISVMELRNAALQDGAELTVNCSEEYFNIRLSEVKEMLGI